MAFHSAGTPVFVYKYKKDTNPEKAGQKLLEDAENIVERMLDLAANSNKR